MFNILISRILVFNRYTCVSTDFVGGNRAIPSDIAVSALHGILIGDILAELHVVTNQLLGAAEIHPAVSLSIELTGTLIENQVDVFDGEIASSSIFRLVGTE
jgi:hypothetical protein